MSSEALGFFLYVASIEDMSIPLWVLLVLGLHHWFGDFVMQSDAMAKGKSKRFGVLSAHVGTYSVVMAGAACIVMPDPYSAMRWVAINAALHLCVDFGTSRISARYFARGDVHNGFVTIGFDQLLHLACLVLTTVLIAK
ncbi:DUF3307 domain-containing protein [Bradyrhizobium sp. PMVTL-01]|uniref:DUF3307 domain-containing protein n=1 Tax=Bradyrhizobium sp. PMVTL-01 TaxID=3434999 RepID=UPI003F719F87